MPIFKAIFGDASSRAISGAKKAVDKINALEADISVLSDDALKAKTAEFKSFLASSKTLEDILPEAFAVVREAGKSKPGG